MKTKHYRGSDIARLVVVENFKVISSDFDYIKVGSRFDGEIAYEYSFKTILPQGTQYLIKAQVASDMAKNYTGLMSEFYLIKEFYIAKAIKSYRRTGQPVHYEDEQGILYFENADLGQMSFHTSWGNTDYTAIAGVTVVDEYEWSMGNCRDSASDHILYEQFHNMLLQYIESISVLNKLCIRLKKDNTNGLGLSEAKFQINALQTI